MKSKVTNLDTGLGFTLKFEDMQFINPFKKEAQPHERKQRRKESH